MSFHRFRLARAAPSLAVAAAIASAAPAALAQPFGELPARVVVRLKPGADGSPAAPRDARRDARRLPAATVALLAARAGWTLDYVRPLGDGSHVLAAAYPGAAPPAAGLANRLRRAAEVERAEVDGTLAVQLLPNDPELPRMWNLRPLAADSFGADFESAWSAVRGHAAPIVAVIDTGVLPHPDLVGAAGSVSPPTGALASDGYDFISDCRIRASCAAGTSSGSAAVAPSAGALDLGDWVSASDRAYEIFSSCKQRDSSWHGIHVAGIVAALADNAEGGAGAAYGARLLPVRALGKCGGYMSDVAESIRWAAGVHPWIPNPTPARVLNLSIGGTGGCAATMQSAIDAATAAGAVVVVAAGNDGGDAANSALAGCSNVIAVAATTRAGELAAYSNRSPTHVALSAPGGDARAAAGAAILSAMNGGTTRHDPAGWSYAERVGTSSAATHVAAAAALVLARNPGLTPLQVRTAVSSPSAVAPFAEGSPCRSDSACGTGILDARRAVAGAALLLRASVDVLRFGNLRVAETALRGLTVANPTGVPLTVARAEIAGDAGFSTADDRCSGRQLASGQTCTMSLAFRAGDEPDTSTATLVLYAPGDGASLLALPMRAAYGSRLEASDPWVTLPATGVGSSVPVALSFANRSGQSERLLPVRLAGPAAASVTADDCSGAELAPGAGCTVALSVTPGAPGDFAIEVSVNTDGPQHVPVTAIVSGSGVDALTAAGERGLVPTAAGGGGCTILPSGAAPDATLALLAVAMMWWRRRRDQAQAPGCPRASAC